MYGFPLNSGWLCILSCIVIDCRIHCFEAQGGKRKLSIAVPRPVGGAEVAAAPERLPQGSTFVTIEGCDHYQFGDFASAEITASISVSQQREEVLNALTSFLQDL